MEEYNEQQTIRKIIEETELRAKKQILYKSFMNVFDDMIHGEDEITCEILKRAQSNTKKHLELQKKKLTSHYYWVTVNAKPGVCPYKFLERVQRYSNRKMIGAATFVIEFADREQPHVHILCYNVKASDSDFRRNTKSTFEPFIDYSECPLYRVLNIKSIEPSKVYIGEKLDYVHGIKYKEDKMDFVVSDREKRENLGISEFYVSGDYDTFFGLPMSE